MTYIDYFIHVLPLSVVLIGLAYWWRSTGLFRPANAKILSWEGMAFLFLRWPWSLFGSLTAVWDRLAGTHVDFRITPKGVPHTDPIPFRVIAPYAALATASAGSAWLVRTPGTAAGFYIFNLVTAGGYCTLILLILTLHAWENRRPVFAPNATGMACALSVLAIVTLTMLAAQANGARGLAAMNVGIRAFTLTETQYSPAGAGKRSSITYRIHPKWRGFGGQNQPREIEHRPRATGSP
ncbi:MAG: hypothetical protein KGO02_16595 [Alphaproteobacteria bacterium]|nr:hypothetical protein [Alphaproteobacteria bacterium]